MKSPAITRLQTTKLQAYLQLQAQMHVYNDLQTATSATKSMIQTNFMHRKAQEKHYNLRMITHFFG
jgi:hypothetical protein